MTSLPENRPVNRRLLDYLTNLLGYEADHIGLIEELMDEAALRGDIAQTLADMVEREACRLRDYWAQVLDTGVNVMGSTITDEERARFRKWHEEITALLDGGQAE